MAANYRIKFMFADAVTCEEEFPPQTTVAEAKTKLIGSSWPAGWVGRHLPPARRTRPAGAGAAAHQRGEETDIFGPPVVRAGRQPARAVVDLRQISIIMCAAGMRFTSERSRRRSLRAEVRELRCPGASALASAWATA